MGMQITITLAPVNHIN